MNVAIAPSSVGMSRVCSIILSSPEFVRLPPRPASSLRSSPGHMGKTNSAVVRRRCCRRRGGGGLFRGGAGRGVGGFEHRGGFLADAGAVEEPRVLRTPQRHRVGEGKVAEIVGGDQP